MIGLLIMRWDNWTRYDWFNNYEVGQLDTLDINAAVSCEGVIKRWRFSVRNCSYLLDLWMLHV